MKSSITSLFLMMLLPFLVSACASYEKKQLVRIENLPSMSAYENKPSVYVDFHMYRGKPESSPTEVKEIHENIQFAVHETFRESGLFSVYTFDEEHKSSVDYTLRLDLYNHGNIVLAALSGFVTGYSLGIIPSAATDNYTLVLKAFDRDGELVESSSNDDAIQTWFGLWFIPASGNTPEKAMTKTIENQINQALDQLIKSNVLKYSAIQFPTAII